MIRSTCILPYHDDEHDSVMTGLLIRKPCRTEAAELIVANTRQLSSPHDRMMLSISISISNYAHI